MTSQFKNRFTHDAKLGARRIYEELKQQIAKGIYAPGALMPSSRSLALELSVARSTVTVAYEQLLAEGLIESKQGARARVVKQPQPQSQPRMPPPCTGPRRRLSAYSTRLQALPAQPSPDSAKAVVDFRSGGLASSDFPALLWKQAIDSTIKLSRERLAYDDPRGNLALRSALQGYIWRARGIRCDIDQIIIVNGSQQGLDLCARLLADPGETVVVEDPCYVMARHTFMAAGATIRPIEVDRDGLKTSVLRAVEARLAYVTPSHQYPLGSVMSITRRAELLAWAQRQNAYVIEDDYDSEYRYDIPSIPPLQVLTAADNVIYLGTLSKALSPTLRLGYLIVPSELSPLFAVAKQITDRHTSQLEQEAAANLIASGAYERHVRKTRRRNAARRDALLTSLQDNFGDRVVISGADSGLHIVAWCKDIELSQEDALIARAKSAGVNVYPLTPAYAAPSAHRPNQAGLIMGYACLDESQITRGIKILAAVFP